jgi:anti-anti-sigma factor
VLAWEGSGGEVVTSHRAAIPGCHILEPEGATLLSPPAPRTDVTVQDLEGDRWLVTLHGEHDASTAPKVRAHLEAVLRTGTAVVVDLSTTSFIDSSILGALIDANKQTDGQEGRRFGLVVAADTPPERLLRLVGLFRLLDVFRSIEDALAEFDDENLDSLRRWKERKQRIVKNEQAFRDYNNRRLQAEDVEPTDTVELLPFVCECGDQDCIETLAVTAAQFVEAHAAPNLFLIKPGHVYPDVERVISEQPTFAIVAKFAGVATSAGAMSTTGHTVPPESTT